MTPFDFIKMLGYDLRRCNRDIAMTIGQISAAYTVSDVNRWIQLAVSVREIRAYMQPDGYWFFPQQGEFSGAAC